MWTWLASFLGGPIVSGLIEAYKANLAAGNTEEKIAADLAARELAVEATEQAAAYQYKIATVGAWYSPDHLFGYIAVAFIGKCVVWDSMLGWGTTPALHGDVATWFGWIMCFWLGKRGVENVASILAGVLRGK
jgi:hypothetical protein